MSSIEVTCPTCTKKTRVHSDLAGKKILCGECNEALRVPERGTAADAKTPPRSVQPWPGAVIGGAALLLLGVGLTLGFLLSRGKNAKEPEKSPAVASKPATPPVRPVAKTEKPRPESAPVVEEPAPAPAPAPPEPPKHNFHPTPAQMEQLAKEAAEAEKQRQLEKLRERGRDTYRLLSGAERAAADAVYRKIQSPKGTFITAYAERYVLENHWAALFESAAAREAIMHWVKPRGFYEFCSNIGEPKGPRRRDLAFDYFFLKDRQTALDLSRQIKRSGIDGLGDGPRGYILDHKELFAAALKSR
jgi:ribosomal protein S27E